MPSQHQYAGEANGGIIYQHYYPYIAMEAARNNLNPWDAQAENLVRDRLGVPRIGEGWVNEMLVVNTVRNLFPELEVEHQGSPPWLGRQRYDAYIAEHRVAIEYNGEQHYNAVGVFGGDAGLAATRARDQRKLDLSNANGVEVVIFHYKDVLSDEVIYDRVKAAIDKQIAARGH